MKLVSVYLSEHQIERLNQYVDATGLLKSEVLRRAIDDFLDEHKIELKAIRPISAGAEFLNRYNQKNGGENG